MKRLIYSILLIILGLPVVGQNSIPSNEAEELVFAPSLQLLSFTATAQANVVHLDWNTAWEKNFDFFTIERAGSNLQFKDIGTLKGSGNAVNTKLYSFTDENPLKGLAYYRLKTINADGAVEYHKTISISFDGLVSSTEAYQKVVNEPYLKLKTSQASVNEIRLLDLSGQMIFSSKPQRGSNYIRLPEQIKAGVYLLIVLDSKGMQHQQKIMV